MTTQLTESGTVMGTVDYMPPEQAEDTHSVDHRADIYSLGATLHYLLTAHPMYQERTIMQKILAHREKPVPDLIGERPDVPWELNGLFQKMVAKSPADRPQSMSEVSDALNALTGLQVTAPSPNGGLPNVHDSSAGQMAMPGTLPRLNSADPAAESIEQAVAETNTFSDSSPVSGTVSLAGRSRATGAGGGRRQRVRRPKWVAPVAITATLFILIAIPIWLAVRDNGNTDAAGSVAGGDSSSKATAGSSQSASGKPSSRADGSAFGTWQPGPAFNVMAGLIPQPRQLPGIGPWQIETVGPRGTAPDPGQIAISSDGKWLVCATRDDSYARLYDTATGQLSWLMTPPDDRISTRARCVAWRPGSDQFAMGLYPGLIVLFDVAGRSGPEFRHPGNVNALAWAPDGRTLASAGDTSDGTIRLWDLHTPDDSTSADQTPGGQAFDELKSQKELNSHTTISFKSLAWSRDGRLLASSGRDSNVHLWNLDDSSAVVIVDPESDVIGDATFAWSPTEDVLAIAEERKGQVRLFDAEGTSIWISQDTRAPEALTWSRDGTSLVVSGFSAAPSFSAPLTMLSRESGEVKSTLETGDGVEFRMVSLCTDPSDGTLLGLRHNRQVDRIDPGTRTITPVCTGPALMTQVKWHPDSRRAASGGSDSRVAIWNTDQPAMVKSVRTRHGCFALTWSPDGSQLATGGDGPECTLWSDSGRQLGNLTQKFATSCNTLAFGRSSDQLLRGGRNAALRLYSLQSGRFTDLFDDDVSSLAWSMKTDHFAAGTETGEIRLWDSDGMPGAVLQGHSSYASDLDWRPGGWELASVAAKYTDGAPDLFLWTWGDPRPRRLPLAGSEGSCLTWSPDGDMLAVGCGDGTIQRMRPGGSPDAFRSVDTLTGHAARVMSVDWSSDGKSLISSSADGTVRLWDADTGRHLWVGIPLPDGTAAIFSTAGELLYGEPEVVDRQFVYMIKDADGQLELLTHSQFQQRLPASEVSE